VIPVVYRGWEVLRLYGLFGQEVREFTNPMEYVEAIVRGNGLVIGTIIMDRLPGIDISTAFLGSDHNHREDGPPLLFETMIFGGAEDGAQVRCSTYEQALAQHKIIVERLSHSQAPSPVN